MPDSAPVIAAITDNDLYKFTMGQVALRYPQAQASYRFINRDGRKFPAGFAKLVAEQVERLADLALTDQEFHWLRTNAPWLKITYLQWLRQFRFHPRQVRIEQQGDDLRIEIAGPWFETIYWEVPLMSIVSGLFFRDSQPDDAWERRLGEKARRLADAGVSWIDFGTRRRFSLGVQDAVNRAMKPFAPLFRGTSNPYLAMRHNLPTQGTYAHELPMSMQSLHGVEACNRAAMDAWVNEYRGDLGIALSDTLTTEVFLRDFDKFYAKLFDGVRLDSGDPYVQGEKIIAHYEKLKIDPRSKVLVFSDGLNDQNAIALHQHFGNRIRVTMGIGTFLTNDVGHKPLNMVIKLVSADFGSGSRGVIKLSDEPGKHTGEKADIAAAKQLLGIAP